MLLACSFLTDTDEVNALLSTSYSILERHTISGFLYHSQFDGSSTTEKIQTIKLFVPIFQFELINNMSFKEKPLNSTTQLEISNNTHLLTREN